MQHFFLWQSWCTKHMPTVTSGESIKPGDNFMLYIFQAGTIFLFWICTVSCKILDSFLTAAFSSATMQIILVSKSFQWDPIHWTGVMQIQFALLGWPLKPFELKAMGIGSWRIIWYLVFSSSRAFQQQTVWTGKRAKSLPVHCSSQNCTLDKERDMVTAKKHSQKKCSV